MRCAKVQFYGSCCTVKAYVTAQSDDYFDTFCCLLSHYLKACQYMSTSTEESNNPVELYTQCNVLTAPIRSTT